MSEKPYDPKFCIDLYEWMRSNEWDIAFEECKQIAEFVANYDWSSESKSSQDNFDNIGANFVDGLKPLFDLFTAQRYGRRN